jgi:hypothetical protein
MGKQSAPAPVQYYQPAPQPTAGDNLAEQIRLQPELLAARQQYDPQFNQLDFEALKTYTPLVNDLMAQEQQRLSPNQYALNEDLARQALEGSKADLPALMKQSALDTYRSEIGSNVGSPIGAEYTSRNLAQLGEQYRNNYQNMGLSLLNKFPTQAQSATPQGAQSFSQQSMGNALNSNINAYGAYNNAMANSFYQPAPRSGGFNTTGALGGAATGAMAGSMFGPWGTAIGGIGGGLMGAFGR